MDCICIVAYTFFNYIWIENFWPFFFVLEEPFFDTLPRNKELLRPTLDHFPDFFKQTKQVLIFTHLGNMSFSNEVCYCLPGISYLTMETYGLILNDLNPVVTVCDGKLRLFLYLSNSCVKTMW